MISVRAFKTAFFEGSYTYEEWFELSIKAFKDVAPSTKISDYDYVQIVPMKSYRSYCFGNDGSQGWRHRRSGYTIPDYCRQQGGCPEIWNKTHKHNLNITEDSPIWNFLVIR